MDCRQNPQLQFSETSQKLPSVHLLRQNPLESGGWTNPQLVSWRNCNKVMYTDGVFARWHDRLMRCNMGRPRHEVIVKLESVQKCTQCLVPCQNYHPLFTPSHLSSAASAPPSDAAVEASWCSPQRQPASEPAADNRGTEVRRPERRPQGNGLRAITDALEGHRTACQCCSLCRLLKRRSLRSALSVGGDHSSAALQP